MKERKDIDRLPPHNLEAEQGVLGCILLSPVDCMGECSTLLSVSMFYDIRNQIIYQAFEYFQDKGVPFDLVLVGKHLRETKSNVELAYVAGLPDTTPSAANLRYYVDIVREKFLLRSINALCVEGLELVRDFVDGQNPADIADRLARTCYKIADADYKGTPTVKELVQGAINQIETYHKAQGKVLGIPTGFQELNRMTSGLQNGDLIIIAGRPSTGKSALGMQIAEHVAVEERLPVGVFSLEMTAASLILRTLCSRARVNLRSIREGYLAERDFPKITAAAGKLASAPIYLDDQPGLSLSQLMSRARRMAFQYGIKLFVVDYLQLLKIERSGQWNRQQEIADISSGLKRLAKELDVPVVALSQLNRDLDKDKARRPRLSDLRESGALEQDADLVGMLYKTKPDEEDSEDAISVNLSIAKQRNGPTGDIELLFRRSITRFEPKSKIEPDDVPEGDDLQNPYDSN